MLIRETKGWLGRWNAWTGSTNIYQMDKTRKVRHYVITWQPLNWLHRCAYFYHKNVEYCSLWGCGIFDRESMLWCFTVGVWYVLSLQCYVLTWEWYASLWEYGMMSSWRWCVSLWEYAYFAVKLWCFTVMFGIFTMENGLDVLPWEYSKFLSLQEAVFYIESMV